MANDAHSPQAARGLSGSASPINRGETWRTVHGVKAGDLVRMLRVIKAGFVGKPDSQTRAVRILQSPRRFTLSSGYGPFALSISAAVPHHGPSIAVAVNAKALIRYVRQIQRDWTPLLECCSRTMTVVLGHRVCCTLPLLPREAWQPLAGDDADQFEALAVHEATDWIELADGLDGKRTLSGHSAHPDGPFLSLTAAGLRVAGKSVDLRIEHEIPSAPPNLLAGPIVAMISMRVVVAVARAYVASGGLVAVTALRGREVSIRYSFGDFALTVQASGDAARTDAAELARSAGEDDEEDDE